MSSLIQKFKVILWKSYILRKRHWLLSLFEVLAPLILFYNFTKYCPTERETGQSYVTYPVQYLDNMVSDFMYSFYSRNNLHIAYAPYTKFTKEVMFEVEERLNQTALKDRFEITNFISENQFNKWLKFNDDKYELSDKIGIIFGNNKPNKMQYKIRVFKEQSAPVDELFGYFYESERYFKSIFLILQMVMDLNFIKRITGIEADIGLQRFPDQGYGIESAANILFPLVTTFSFVFIMPAILKKLVEEKITGIKELQKMMGLHGWMLWTGWMIHSLMIYGVSAVIITAMFRYHWPDHTSLLYDVDNGLIILYLFMLFVVTIVLYCFAVSTFFTSPNIAMISGILLWIAPPFSFLEMLVSSTPASKYVQLATCLSPPMCLSWAFTILINFQHKGKVWSWSMFFEKGTTGGLSMAHVIFMFYFDWFFFAFITWYVDSVKPGPFGRAKPFYFILNIFKKESEVTESNESDDHINFEPPPHDSKIGISIQNLRKVFGSKVAVDSVNLDIYEGEITALLGHNGAGKTTTMSILTGLYSPSKGAVIVNGKNIFSDMDQFRHSLGLCPQHNLLFSYLTVIEHLVFFGMLKGLPRDRAEAVGLKLLVSFHMAGKSNEFVSKLSGGMKRKLCLSIALMGDPKVIMLDEPTSGMDPESRRDVWEILLSYRGARTILITTHFMEEADVLGDRIAIMDHGRVSCYGTSMFLKKLYGTGYHIVISKDVQQSEIPISTVVESHLNEPKLKTSLPTQLTYNVSTHDAPKFSSLFEILEARKGELGITGVSIACTTMEDVFLRVAEGGLPLDDKAIPAEDLFHSVSAALLDTKVHVQGWQLTVLQLRALFIKKSLVLYRTWLGTLAFAVTPLLAIMLVLSSGFSGDNSQTDESIEMNLSLYGDTVVPYTVNYQEYTAAFQDIVSESGSTTDYFTENINDGLIAKLSEDQSYYHKAVVGVEFNRSSITGLYNIFAVHSPPISLSLLTNSILKSFNPSSSVVVINQPFSGNSDSEEALCDRESERSYVQALVKVLPWILLSCGLMFIMCRFISLPLIERANNAKQLQLMTKLSPFVYWLSHFLWDFILYLSASVSVIVAVWLLDKHKDFTLSGNMDFLFLLLLLYGISGIPFAYLFSFLTRSSAKAASVFLMFNLITGIIAPLITFTWGMSQSGSKGSTIYYDLTNGILCFNPLYAETAALIRLLTIMVLNSSCHKCSTVCVSLDPFKGLPNTPDSSILEFVIFLMTEWILFWLIIFLIEFGLLKLLWAKTQSLWIGPMLKYTIIEDDDVLEEKQKAKAFFYSNLNQQQQNGPVLKVCGLGKKYNRKSVAVHDASFLVEKGQCFGLLGVNGAGKTTTFKMLTGEEIPSVGNASILCYDLIHTKSKYLQEIGYCPQFDAIIEVLTGEEMLRLYALLRGTTPYKVESEVDNWIQFMGIQEFAKAKCGTYSGGNKRKLSTAMAVIGDPPVVFLDEPTAGVDPVSRRKLWNVLAQCQKTGQAIVLTSHSMEECEALCSRLTILVGGHMKCIGTTQYLKQRFGQGYTIMIKLCSTCPDYGSALNSFKNTVNRTFSNCFIKDEHKGLLHYHITDNNVLLSVLFSKLEMLRQNHSIVEDYTVGDTTLEQVFMSFARQIQPLIVIEPVDV